MTRILFSLTLVFLFIGGMFVVSLRGEEVNNEYTELLDRGAAYYEKGQYDQAIAEYTKAIELQQDSAGAYNNRGNACYNKGH